MAGSTTQIVMSLPADKPLPLSNVVAPPPIVHKLLAEHHPAAVDKDKSIHSEHGVIHYPFYFGGLASAVSGCCTQPLGVGKHFNSSNQSNIKV